MRHRGFHKSINSLLFMTDNRQFHKFIIITIILTSPHDSAIRWEEVLRVLWEVPLLDDLRALVEFAHAGSIAGAADRLFRTPSAKRCFASESERLVSSRRITIPRDAASVDSRSSKRRPNPSPRTSEATHIRFTSAICVSM